MNFDDIKWLWKGSGKAFNYSGLNNTKLRAKLTLSALTHREAVKTIRNAPVGSHLRQLIEARPDMLGVFIWPFQSSAWDAGERWERIFNHCAVIDDLGPPFKFGIEERMVLADLEDLMPGFKVVLDQPKWFMREGLLVANIFIDDFRAFSLAFSFYRESDGSISAFIGAMQGRNRDDILDTYRDLTKKLHGVRPRDFLVEIFRMLIKHVRVSRILAVSDACRHHRHPYFSKEDNDFTLNYDDIWRERGGERIDETMFELSTDVSRRDFEDIKPKKRSLYRKRYELLDEIEKRLSAELPKLTSVIFKDS